MNTKFCISILDFYKFDREHYIIGENERMLRVKVKEHRKDCRSRSVKIKYQNYWADHILQREHQAVTYKKVTEGLIDKMIRGFDNIIFACGPHCSGKTFNIMGRNRKYKGIAPRLIDEMLALRNADGSGVGMFAMSCLEIRNDRVFDLMNDDTAARRPCLIKDVYVYKFDSSENAKQKLWEAHARRTVIQKTNENIMDHTSHLYDLVITFYWREISSNAIGTKRAKVHIVELAGANSNNITSKPPSHEVQVNRNVLEFSQFFKHVTTNNCRGDHRYSTKSSTTSALLKYCEDSFSKRHTTLSVFCHIRPELKFLRANLAVLKFAEAIRELPDSVVIVDASKPAEEIELYKLQERLAHELHLYGKVDGHGSMMEMTEERFERLRNKVLDFLQCKTDDIELDKWTYVDAYTVSFLFREYRDAVKSKKHNKRHKAKQSVIRSHVKSKSNTSMIETMKEESLHAVDHLLASFSDVTMDEKKK